MWFTLALPAILFGCSRCGTQAGATSSGAAPVASAEAPAAASSAAAPAPETDVPEIRDTGPGRATAALRAVLTAEGIAFDAATLARECKVDDDGASIDDLEDVAVAYGLDAAQVVVPAEHLLLPEPRMTPAVVVVDGPDDAQDFVVVWRIDGDRVQIMSPIDGRAWVPRSDLKRSFYVHEATMDAGDLRAAMAAQAFRDALTARMIAIGAPRAAAQAVLDRAVADPGWRGLASLDAALRQLETAPAGSGAGARISAAFDCAFEDRCEGGLTPPPEALWWARPGSDGEVRVRGVLMLAIAGRKAVAGDGGGG